MNEQLAERTAEKSLSVTRSMWDDNDAMVTAVRMAEYLAGAHIIPQQYQKNPGDCLVAIDFARRMGLSPVTVMQQSQMVRGNFTWKGSACKAMIDGSRKFVNSRYETVGKPGEMKWGCRLVAERVNPRCTVHGPWVTMQMAKDEGWIDKDGSKWKTMPELMMRYRAASFFAKTECPEVLMGFQTAEEIEDITPQSPPVELQEGVFTDGDKEPEPEARKPEQAPEVPEEEDQGELTLNDL